jgi:hypothetical protein
VGGGDTGWALLGRLRYRGRLGGEASADVELPATRPKRG